jgi:hypothetical protein
MTIESNGGANVSDSINKFKAVIARLDDQFQSYLIFIIIAVVVIFYLFYLIRVSKLRQNECTYMNQVYPSIDGYIAPITSSNVDFSGNLFDYYIKSAYNCCSGGSYKNDYVDICNLKAVIKQGVRCLDFEIYSINNQPVVATSTGNSFNVKETYNSVPFGGSSDSVMETINSYAFANGTAPNPTDPLIIHLRIQSANQEMYTNLATIFSNYDDKMLGYEYSYENTGRNLGEDPLLSFQNKIILIVDKTNTEFLHNPAFLEYVNMTSNSAFMRTYTNSDIVNSPDVDELTDYNRAHMSIVFPDTQINPPNPNTILARVYGCQMIAMRYQYVDNYLLANAAFFDRAGYAFVLKPAALRNNPIIIPDPIPQDPANSYAPRTVNTPYQKFQNL